MPTTHLRLLVALALLVAGCGARPAPSAAPVRYLGGDALRSEFANGFRAGLERLAVMSQPPDDAADVGQSLPSGLLDGVTCSPATARPKTPEPWRWTCSARWKTAAGHVRATEYAVRLFASGCFAAGADPPLAPRRDPTIKSFSEHPLNTFVSVKAGC